MAVVRVCAVSHQRALLRMVARRAAHRVCASLAPRASASAPALAYIAARSNARHRHRVALILSAATAYRVINGGSVWAQQYQTAWHGGALSSRLPVTRASDASDLQFASR